VEAPLVLAPATCVKVNLGSRIYMHTHAGSILHNSVNLNFFLLNSGSMRAKFLPYESICVSSLMLIAQVVFLLERGHKHACRHTDTESHNATDHPTHASATAVVVLGVSFSRPLQHYSIATNTQCRLLHTADS